MTRLQYLNALAEARQIIEESRLRPMKYAPFPGKVSRALQRWNSASDEEREEAAVLPTSPSGAVRAH